MTLRLQEPVWLLVIAMVIPLAVIGLRWFRAMSRTRRWTCVLLRAMVIGVLAAALAGATLLREVDRLAVIAVVDISGSVQRLFDPATERPGTSALSDRVAGFLNAASERPAEGPGAAAARRADDLSAVILYDGSPLVVAPIEARAPGPFVPGPLPTEPGPTTDATNTAAALRVAGALAPPDAAARMVVFTDGNDTAGDALAAARALHRARSGTRSVAPTPIDVVPLEYAAPREVGIELFEAPSAAPAESTVQLRVTLSASAAVAGELQIAREGQPIDASPDSPGMGRRIALPPGTTVVRVPVRLPAGRVHRFEAIFVPDDPAADAIAANNRAQSVTLTPGRTSVLLIDGVSGGDPTAPGGTLGRTLKAAGVEVESLAPERVSSDPLWIQRYDLVVLQNVAADALPDGAAETLARYVTDQGGGLVMVGGPDSFGAGGWKGSPIEPILPVRLDLPEQVVSPAAAVVLVIDSSGSMGFRVSGSRKSKQTIANEGAAVAAQALDKSDLLGVIIFNNRHQVRIPLGPNRDPQAAAERIRTITADGGTNLPPALAAAHEQLRRAKADVKHIIVLSDGRSQNTEQLAPLAQNIRADGIRVSTIAVGDEADTQTMASIAGYGEGAYYRVIDPNLLPRIFLKAIRVVRTPLIREKPFQPVTLATGSPALDGIESPPMLNGLVLTQARPEPTITYAMATPTGEPLLAHWNAGVGRVAAFTSDAHHWAAPWLDWPGYSRLWTQLTRTVARPQPDRGQELSVEIDGDDLVVRLLARDAEGRPLDNLTVPGTLHGPGGSRADVRLAQVGAGEYQARVPAAAAGSYVVSLTPRVGETGGRAGRALPPVVGGVARSGGAEFRRLTSNPDAVRRLAEAGGGRVLSLDRPAEARLFDRTGLRPAIARQPLWPWLLVAGIGLYLLDVASRRVAWDRYFGVEFGAVARRRAAEAVRARAGRAAATVDKLRRRDEELAGAAAASGGPAKLSTEDARALVRAQAERRRQARAAARSATADASEDPAPQARDASTDAPQAPSDAPSSDRAPNLFEAKRRARRQLEGDGDGRDDPPGR